MSGRSYMGNGSPTFQRYADMTTTRSPPDARSSKTGVSFSNEFEDTHVSHGPEAGISLANRTASEMHSLRAIQTARAVVASERQKLLTRTQATAEKSVIDRNSMNFEPEKRASEEQLFEEVGLLMQERDLLLREKSALQAILASSAEEIRRLFDAEQKHVMEMKSWLQQKESLEQERDSTAMQNEQLRKELDALRRSSEQALHDSKVRERERSTQTREVEDLQERLAAAQQELALLRSSDQAHRGEREEWARQHESLTKQLAESITEAKAAASHAEQLRLDTVLHRKAAERWEQERASLQEDRAETERLRLLAAQHAEEVRRWGAVHDQLLKERADGHTQLQLALQQIEQQQKNLELHNGWFIFLACAAVC